MATDLGERNSEFSLVVLRLRIDLVSHPSYGEGGCYIYIYIYIWRKIDEIITNESRR